MSEPYTTPLEGNEDSSEMYQWRRLTARLLQLQVPRSRLVAELLALKLAPLFGSTARLEVESLSETYAAVRSMLPGTRKRSRTVRPARKAA